MGRTVIAERKLAFSAKEDSERKPLLIRIFAPKPVDPGSHLFRPDVATSSCMFESVSATATTFSSQPARTTSRNDTASMHSLSSLKAASRDYRQRVDSTHWRSLMASPAPSGQKRNYGAHGSNGDSGHSKSAFPSRTLRTSNFPAL